MSRYWVKLLKKEKVARDAFSFLLSKPRGFMFRAGEYMQVFLPAGKKLSIDPNYSRTYSIASAPHEKHLMFVTRIFSRASLFKKKLSRLNEGSKIMIEAPSGEFVLPRDRREVVFLVGGIGITAVRSMVLSEARRRASRNMALFYSNPTSGDTPFLEELRKVKGNWFRFVPTMTSSKKNHGWDGERGRISFSMIKRYVSHTQRPVYYIVGPPGFVVGMTQVLRRAKISPTHIKTEEYSGY